MRKSVFSILLAGILALSPLSVQAAEREMAVKSFLTGKNVTQEVGNRRPIAVMMDNVEIACPQSGIGSAGVVYEAPVEADITRLMAIIENYDGLDKIGAVRSCRDYYISYAREFDAIYCHFGQAVYAEPYFEQGIIDHLNGLQLDGTVYYRVSDREAPHNAYTSFDRLQSGIESAGFRQNYEEGHTGHYKFAPEGQETTLENGTDAKVVKLENFTVNHPWFEYDETTGEYNRFQFGEAQVDEKTGKQLSCTNIILQYSNCPPYDANGYLNIDTTSGGSGKFITRGKAVDITWSKDSIWGPTKYTTADGAEILLNPGVTWVEIIQNDRTGDILYQ